jgi:hypothetical protein
MSGETVQISEKSWGTLLELAEESGESPIAILERAITRYAAGGPSRSSMRGLS